MIMTQYSQEISTSGADLDIQTHRYLFTAPKLRYLNHLLQFFHDGIPSFEILEGWSMGDPFKGTKGDWSTLVKIKKIGIGNIKSLRN